MTIGVGCGRVGGSDVAVGVGIGRVGVGVGIGRVGVGVGIGRVGVGSGGMTVGDIVTAGRDAGRTSGATGTAKAQTARKPSPNKAAITTTGISDRNGYGVSRE